MRSAMITRVSGGDLRPRIDPAFYAPEHLARERRLRALGVERLPIGAMSSLVTDGTHKTPIYLSDGVPFLSATNIEGGAVQFHDHKWISAEEFGRLNAWNCAPIPGDVLVAKSGSIGNAAVVMPNVRKFAVFESVAIVRCERVDAAYLATFLNSQVGQHEIQRQTKGAVIRHLHLEDLREVQVPEFHRLVQHYIGDKVRQAERLRARARALEERFVRTVLPGWVDFDLLPAARGGRVKVSELGRNLNAGAHAPHRRAIRRRLQSQGAVAVEELATITSPTTGDFHPRTTYVGLDAIDSATCKLSPSTAGAEEVVGTVRSLREGPVISRLRPYLNKVSYIPAGLASAVGSTELLLVRPKPLVSGWYLYGVLKLSSSVLQLNPVATGSTHPRVDREDVLDLLVPWHEDHEALGQMLHTAQCAYFACEQLTTAATRLVESIIEGSLAEADLIAAQRGLEAGGREADRALLRGLRRRPEPDSPPLFPDVDVLYALLDEAGEMGAEA